MKISEEIRKDYDKELDPDYILPKVERLEKQNEELINALKKLYKVNQNVNEIIADHNSKSKEKIGLNVLDLMREIEIESLLKRME